MLALPAVAELRDRPLLAVGDEDRVVAEAAAAARRVGDRSLDDAGAAENRAVGRDRDELGDVARSSIGRALELAEQLRDRRRSFRRVARRVQPGATVERGDLDAGVLADGPAADALPRERGLDECV